MWMILFIMHFYESAIIWDVDITKFKSFIHALLLVILYPRKMQSLGLTSAHSSVWKCRGSGNYKVIGRPQGLCKNLHLLPYLDLIAKVWPFSCAVYDPIYNSYFPLWHTMQFMKINTPFACNSNFLLLQASCNNMEPYI